MNETADPIKAVARKSSQLIFQAMQTTGMQTIVAGQAGVAESTVSRFKTEQAEQFCLYLACCGLEVGPIGRMPPIDPKKVQSLIDVLKTTLPGLTVEQLAPDI